MFKSFLAWLARLFSSHDKPQPFPPPTGPSSAVKYIARAEQDPPDVAADGVLHLIADGLGQYWLGVLQCPCGCGASIQLSMTQPARPCWKFRGTMEQPSLWPSVRRAAGCKSHFVLRQGSIVWCAD